MSAAYREGRLFVKEAMERFNINVRELARDAGVNRATLTKILSEEHGGSETKSRMKIIEAAVGFLRDRNGGPIPVLGHIPAGAPITIEDAVAERYIDSCGLDSKSHFGLVVRGDSMAPDIQDGDLVILRRAAVKLPNKEDGPTPFDAVARFTGRVCAVTLNGESTLKRIEISRSGADYQLILRPGNPAHPVRVIRPDDELIIQGEFCRLIRNA